MFFLIFNAFIFGLLVSLLGYSWGINNQISHIPVVLRIINQNFLKNDFYINSAFFSSQRFFYGLIIAFFTKAFGLKITYLLMTVLSNVLVIFIISLFVYKFFHSKKIIIVASFLSTLSLIEIGGASFITLNYLIPHLLSLPFALFGIYFGFFDNFLLATFFFIISSLIHPMLGVETGFLSFFLWCLIGIFFKKDKIDFFKKIIFSSFLFVIFFIFITNQTKINSTVISDKEFIEINIFFRNPHHHLFYTIDKITQLITTCFIISIFFAFYHLKKEKKYEKILFFSFFGILITLLIVFFGFYFTEIKPVKLIAAAQTLRLFYFIKFLGIVIFSGLTTLPYSSNHFLVSLFHPMAIFYYLFFDILKKLAQRFFKIKEKIFDNLYIFGLFFLIVWLIDIERFSRKDFVLFFFFLLTLMMYQIYQTRRYFYIFVGFIFLIFIFNIINPSARFIVTKWILPYKPQFELSYTHYEMPFLSKFAKEKTKKEAIFLTPPDFGQFRYLAERAMVVDFKTFIFNEKMKEWRERILEIYGKPKNFFYYSIVNELNENYKKINDEKIRQLQKKYHFNCVILYQETKTTLSLLYKFGNYKVVDFKNCL